jgi:hypothetical protein
MKSLTDLDIRNFNTNNCKDLTGIFDECTNNSTIYMVKSNCPNLLQKIPETFEIKEP